MADNNFNASFSYEQYKQWADDSKQAPLPRRNIDLGGKLVEVFALPGYEKHPGRYIYSATSTAIAAEKDESSFRRFMRSKSPFALPYKDFDLRRFFIEESDLPISGCLSQMAFGYWLHQATKGNLVAAKLIVPLGSTSLDLLADTQFGIDRVNNEYERLIRERLFTQEAVEYKTHFFPNYYRELYRIFQKTKRKRGKPPISL